MWHLRAAIMTVVGALVLHQARYLLAPPGHLHSGTHAYFAWAIPLVGVLLVAVLLELGVRLARRADKEIVAPMPPVPILSAFFAFALLTVFGTQEALEARLVDGAFPSQIPLVTDGAWVSLPLAIVLGWAIALLLRGMAKVVAMVMRRTPTYPASFGAVARLLTRFTSTGLSGIGRRLAPRGPPLPAR